MRRIWLAAGLFLLTACAPAPSLDPGHPLITAVPTLDPGDPAAVCAAIDRAWGQDWERAIDLLSGLVAQDAECAGEQPAVAMLYTAYYDYGRMLASTGDTGRAQAAFESALALDPTRPEARQGLRDLGIFTPPPVSKCRDAEVAAARAALPPYEPSGEGDFVTVDEAFFRVGEALYPVQGINYYPVHYPGRRFLTETPLEVIAAELDLIQEAGFNTLRVFLWHEALFTCPGNGAVPQPAAFARLDALIHMAAERGLRLILVLNDRPDLTVYPLYTSPAHTVAQMVFLAERYRDEPAIMAWDLRSEGDADYAEDGPSGGFARQTVLTWLAETAALIREHDDRHLITAGWLHDAESTAPYVDFVSFQHWDDAIRLRERIAAIRAQTNGPILLEAFGYSTYLLTPLQQGQRLQEAIQVAEYDGLAGWLIWTAFDFPPDATCQEPDCPDPDGGQNHFGLWGAGYEPKIGLGLVRIALYDPARVP